MAAHKLTRLSKSILEQPQLITAAKFEEIAQVLEDRNHGLYVAAEEALSESSLLVDNNYGSGLSEGSVGVLSVEGTTSYRKTGWEALCGGCSYQGLLEDMELLTKNPDVNVILMNVNSGGGEAYRCFETSRELRKMADESGKRIIAYVDGMSASAAYALSSCAHEVIMNPDAEVGSIGVVIRLMNNNKKLEKEGLEVTYVTAGASKVPFNSEGEFREDFIAGLDERVNELYDNFVSHVASLRGIEDSVVRSTEAKMFSADKAIELGLVDKVMEGFEFNEYLADASANTNSTVPSKVSANTLQESNKETLMTDTVTQEASADNAVLLAQMEAMSKQLEKFQAKELAAEKESLIASFDNTPFVSECKEDLVSFLMSNEVSSDHKSLMNTVIGSATKLNSEIAEAAATQVAEAQEATAAAEAAKEAIKAEFGTKEEAITEELKEEVSGGSLLADKIEKKKAALAATK
tara:strand:- start:253 stop:1644 length:1392 start_codon:yes stop_codon:yes gene_type:complete